MENRTKRTGRIGFAKVTAALVALLLLGVMASGALADGDPFSALTALTSSTSTSTDTTGAPPTSTDTTSASTSAVMTTAPATTTDAATTNAAATTAAPTTTDTTTTSAASTTAAATTSAAALSAPSITSDKADYGPGTAVALSGSNWLPGEAVHIFVNDDQGQTWARNVDVTADASGQITDQFNLPDWFVATYAVKATGAVSGTATASFTDGNVKISSQVGSFGFTTAIYPSMNCTGTPTATIPDTATTSDHNMGAGGTGQSVLLVAGQFNSLNQAFLNWTTPSSGNAVTYAAGNPGHPAAFSASDRSTCILGFQTGSRDIQGVYAGKGTQTITFNQPPTPAAYNSTFTVSATASPSGLPVTITASGGCTINASNLVTMTSGTTACTLTASQAGNATYNAAADVVRTVAASKLNQTITFGALASKTFGDPDFAISASASSGLTVSFSALGDCNFAADGKVHITGVGSCTITAAQAGDNNYNAASSVPQTFTIAKATATLALSNLSQTYDGSPKSATVTTTPSGLTGVSVTYAGSATAPTNAGSYAVVASLNNPNYTATNASGTLVIGKASQTITFPSITGKTYGDAPFTPTATASSTLPVSLDVKVGSNSQCTVSGNQVTLTGAGSCTLVASQAGNGNYNSAAAVEQTFTIAKAHATLTLSNLTATYDGTAKPVTVTSSPAGLSGVSVTYAGSASPPRNAGSYAVVASLSNSNYDATDATGTLAIAAKSITGSFTAANKVYDGTTSATVTGRSLNGVVSGDTVSLTGGTATFGSKDVGTSKTVTLTGAALAGGDAGNYTLASVGTTTADVTAKPITGSFTAASKIYDGTTSAAVLTRSLNGDVAGDTVSLSGGTATFATKTAALGKTVTLTGASLAGGDAGNYTLTSVATATADIQAKPITGSFTVANKVYDGTTSATVTGRSLNGDVSGDTVSLTGGTATFGSKDVGTGKTVTLTGAALAGGDAGNYTLTSVGTTTADVTAKPITGSFTASNKVYDGTTSATVTGRSLNGDVSGDAVSLTGGTASFGSKDVGTGKTVTLTGAALAGGDAGNYTLTSVATTTADVTVRTVIGHIVAQSKVYDGGVAAVVAPYALDNTISGDDVTLVTSNGHFDNKNVGTGKTVTADLALAGAAKTNYILSSATATTIADITAKPVTGSFKTANKVYDGTTSAAATDRALSGTVMGDAVSLTGGTASFGSKDVGTAKTVTLSGATLAGADAGNYDLTSVGTEKADITAKPITGNFTTPASRVYDGTADAAVTGRSLNDTVLTDTVSLVGGSASFANKNVGTGKIVTLTGATLAGADAGNYDLTSVGTEKADITAKPLTGSFTANDKVYDGTNVATVKTQSLPGIESGDDVSLVVSSPHFDNRNVGTAKDVTGDLSLSGAQADNYSLTSATDSTKADITKKPITVVADDKTKVYGSADPALTETVPAGALESGDSLSGELTRAPGKDVGDYAITKGTRTAGGNYDLTVTPGTLKITKKPITGSFTTPASRVYDGTAAAAVTGRSLNDTVSGDAVTLTGGTASFGTKDVGTAKTVTLTGASLAGADAPNYSLTSVGTEKADITAKPITGKFTANNKVYDGNVSAVVASRLLNGDVAGDAVNLSGGTATFGSKDVGTGKTVTLDGATLTGADAGNYTLTSVDTAKADITAKPITGNFTTPASRVYDGTTDAAVTGRSLNETVAGDSVSLSGGTASFANKNVGIAKMVTLTGAALAGADAGNYSLTSVGTEKADITAKTVTGSFTAANKVYDGNVTASIATRSLSGQVTGDAVSLSGGTAAFDNKNVGTAKNVTATGFTLSSTDAGNYQLAAGPWTATADITALRVTVTADPQSKVYGSADPVLTYKVTSGSLVSGELFTGSLTRDVGESVVGSPYAIKKGTLSAGSNYDLTYAGANLTITPRPITVTPNAQQSKIVGSPDPVLTYKVTTGSLVTGDSFTGSLTRDPGETVGPYATRVGTLSAGSNYTQTFVSGVMFNIYYGYSGFLQPINDTAHQTGLFESKFKLGQTIPAKFVLKNAAGVVVQQTGNPTFTRSANLGSCDATTQLETQIEIVTPDPTAVFTWDGSQYHYNWSTKGMTAGEYRIYANLADGTKNYVDICLS